MPPPPFEITSDDLIGRIVRWNLAQCARGGAVLALSALLWLLTFYGMVVLESAIPESVPDALSRVLPLIALTTLAGIGCSSRSPLFVREKPDDRFAGVEPAEWKLNDQWGMEFWLALPAIAPALTLYGIRIMGRCFSFDKRRINLACRTHAYLTHLDDWVPYPKLLSQRRAVALLYHLELIYVSRRFGNLEIRVRRRTGSIKWSTG